METNTFSTHRSSIFRVVAVFILIFSVSWERGWGAEAALQGHHSVIKKSTEEILKNFQAFSRENDLIELNPTLKHIEGLDKSITDEISKDSCLAITKCLTQVHPLLGPVRSHNAQLYYQYLHKLRDTLTHLIKTADKKNLPTTLAHYAPLVVFLNHEDFTYAANAIYNHKKEGIDQTKVKKSALTLIHKCEELDEFLDKYILETEKASTDSLPLLNIEKIDKLYGMFNPVLQIYEYIDRDLSRTEFSAERQRLDELKNKVLETFAKIYTKIAKKYSEYATTLADEEKKRAEEEAAMARSMVQTVEVAQALTTEVTLEERLEITAKMTPKATPVGPNGNVAPTSKDPKITKKEYTQIIKDLFDNIPSVKGLKPGPKMRLIDKRVKFFTSTNFPAYAPPVYKDIFKHLPLQAKNMFINLICNLTSCNNSGIMSTFHGLCEAFKELYGMDIFDKRDAQSDEEFRKLIATHPKTKELFPETPPAVAPRKSKTHSSPGPAAAADDDSKAGPAVDNLVTVPPTFSKPLDALNFSLGTLTGSLTSLQTKLRTLSETLETLESRLRGDDDED